MEHTMCKTYSKRSLMLWIFVLLFEMKPCARELLNTPPFMLEPFVSIGKTPTPDYPDMVSYIDTATSDIEYYKDSLNRLHISVWQGATINSYSKEGSIAKQEFVYEFLHGDNFICWARIKVVEMYDKNGLPKGLEFPVVTNWSEVKPNTMQKLKARLYLLKVLSNIKVE